MHARLVARLERRASSQEQPPILLAREGRRLRVGFVLPAFDGTEATQAALPMIGRLDSERFEVEVYVLSLTDSPWERYARTTVGQVQALPPDSSEQIRVISQAGLDVLVYASDLGDDKGTLIKLSAHRLAPLQVATSAQHAVTTGCAMIDLFVAGEQSGIADLADQFSERVGLVAGPTRVFDQATAGHSATKQWNRSDVNLAEGAMVFVAAGSWGQIGPETQGAWAEILAELPGSFLLVQRTGPDSDCLAEAQQHSAGFDRILTAHGVTEDRLLVSPSALPSHADLEALLKIGDVFLDVNPSDDETAALSALKANIPVISMGGATLRSGRVAALLRSLGLSNLVATNPAEYAALAVRLAKDGKYRAGIVERIRPALVMGPRVLDALARGDEFGDLIEVAFDEVLAAGASAFRANRVPLRATVDAASVSEHLAAGQAAYAQSDYFIALTEARSALRANPASSPARTLLGRIYLGVDQPRRAVEYLSAATASGESDAACWLDLARAYKLNQQPEQAVQAIVASLRLDPNVATGCLMLVEIADELGAPDLARRAVRALGAMMPHHPQLEELRSRFESTPDSAASL
jgi:tetratricopeptide (TPR) repeat protein